MISIKSICSIYQCPVGILTIVNDGFYVTHILYGNHSGEFNFEQKNSINARVMSELNEYFNGTRKTFDIPIKPSGTDFQKKVWNALSKIPYGETRSYGEIADLIGKSSAVRAIGMANAKNPIAIIIPCHRVTNSNGSLAGYTGGAYTKKRLLDLEKSTLTDINQKLLKENKASSELLNMALLRTQIYGFYYYPQENVYLFPERTANKYTFKSRYENAPYSFCNKLIFPNDRRRFILMNNAIQDGEQYKTDTFKSISGKYWWKITLSTAEYDENDKPLITVGTVEDVTEEKLLQIEKDNQFNLSQQILLLLSNLFTGVHKIDLNTGTIRSIRMLHNIPEIEINIDYDYNYWLTSFSQYYHPIDRKRLLEQFSYENILYQRNLGTRTIEDNYRRFMDNSYCWISNKAILNNKNFDSEFALIVQMDVSDSYQKSSIINALSSGYYAIYYLNIYDDTYEILRSDKIVKKKMNIKPTGCYSKIMEQYITNFVHPEDRINIQKFSNIINLRQHQYNHCNEISMLFRKKVGTHYECVELKYIMNISHEPQYIVLALKNVDETIRHELDTKQLLLDALNNSESINLATNKILSTVSHDMQKCINSINQLTTLAIANTDNLENVNSCLEGISQASKQLTSQMDKILNISTTEHTNFNLQYSRFSISQLIQSTIEVVFNSMKEKHIQFDYNFHNMYYDRIIGDELRMKQFMSNILGNAIKFNKFGGNIKLTVEQLPIKEDCIITHKFIVSDTGIGISEDDVKRIFEPFARANDDRIQNISGNGVGLTLVGSIVKSLGGTIKVDSTLNKGTTFTVTLNLKTDDNKNLTNVDVPNINVLVLNNNKNELEYTRTCLESLNINVTTTTSYSDALDKLNLAHAKSEDYFAILIDNSINDINFMDLIDIIRENFGRQPLKVLVSSYDLTPLEDCSNDFGIDGFVHKPMFVHQLANIFNLLTKDIKPFYNKDFFAIRPLNNTNCLLIEDNKSHQNIDKSILKMLGSNVDTASSNSDAIECIQCGKKYDYIVMNINQTYTQEFETSVKIHSIDKSVPIIAMTSHYFPEIVKLAIKSGMSATIVKPIDVNTNQLVNTILSNVQLAKFNR